ncbi:hypothetical protein B0J13DRAFT_629290 [Dactylonectria estremocensis]|uniref:Uncharacterized protein n=1 Tax=Dactylonectria estremocensis TaxID=1079267 RepID=A0A9P9IH36_9HYPO|nr:hypothetical protein B0J13DRAFT_629290 [Dactylonectria estremocensis]
MASTIAADRTNEEPEALQKQSSSSSSNSHDTPSLLKNISAASSASLTQSTDDTSSPAALLPVQQPVRHCLRSLSAATKYEAILQWPVFKGVIEDSDVEIQSFLFQADASRSSNGGGCYHADDSRHGKSERPAASHGIDENAFVQLCRNFLTHICPRNPVLEKGALMSYAKDAAANGLQWNAPSCLVSFHHPNTDSCPVAGLRALTFRDAMGIPASRQPL